MTYVPTFRMVALATKGFANNDPLLFKRVVCPVDVSSGAFRPCHDVIRTNNRISKMAVVAQVELFATSSGNQSRPHRIWPENLVAWVWSSGSRNSLLDMPDNTFFDMTFLYGSRHRFLQQFQNLKTTKPASANSFSVACDSASKQKQSKDTEDLRNLGLIVLYLLLQSNYLMWVGALSKETRLSVSSIFWAWWIVRTLTRCLLLYCCEIRLFFTWCLLYCLTFKLLIGGKTFIFCMKQLISVLKKGFAKLQLFFRLTCLSFFTTSIRPKQCVPSVAHAWSDETPDWEL